MWLSTFALALRFVFPLSSLFRFLLFSFLPFPMIPVFGDLGKGLIERGNRFMSASRVLGEESSGGSGASGTGRREAGRDGEGR